jgi:hypothetical protein
MPEKGSTSRIQTKQVTEIIAKNKASINHLAERAAD